jgi:hypothetical protein
VAFSAVRVFCGAVVENAMPIKPSKKLQIRRTQDNTFRAHYLNEWLDERRMSAMELLDALNEPAGMDPQIIDKSQVYRWLKGQLPHHATQRRIAETLGLVDNDTGEPDPKLLMTHPAQVWIARKVSGLEPEDIDRLKTIIETVFPEKARA